MTLLWSRAFRSRGGPNQMIVAHADGSTSLEFLNTNDSGGNDIWQHLVDLPLSNCATEYLSLARCVCDPIRLQVCKNRQLKV